MAIDAETRREIEKQARQYDVEKEKVKTRIQKNVETAIEKLTAAEKTLLDEVEIEFGENPFLKFLTKIDSGNPPEDAEVRSALARGVPKDVGPSEESFCSLLKEIDAFVSWREKAVLVPSNITTKSTTWDSSTLVWDAVEGASFYQIEMDGSKSWDASTENTFTKRGLLAGTEHSFRVRAVRGSSVSEWSDSVKGRTQKLLVPSNITTKSITWDSITVTWDDDIIASSYQIEVDGGKTLYRVMTNTFTQRGLLADTEHSFRVRAVRGSTVSEWSDVVKEKTQKELVPSNITAQSGITWDSITLTWDVVEGASFYQIEVDGSKFWGESTTNSFTQRRLPADTEHSFRVRVVKGSTVSEWSDAVNGRTQKKSFESSVWKECPDYVDEENKYSLDEKNPRVATRVKDYGWCTIIGNTALPLNTVTSWSVKVLESKLDGGDIHIGVAPSHINQNEDDNYDKCGWYFYCYASVLCSGPPHEYRGKKYGPRKERGNYIHTGDSVGVVMDTAKGELSFVLNGVNLGVAYEGIPLDRPLVPCVLLGCKGDSVELVV